MATQLEKAIIQGARPARREYEKMTGWWLFHGPESFLTCTVASKVSKKVDYTVFIEASPKRILDEREEKLKGKPPAYLNKRFDIVVWQKSKNNIQAIVEVKKAWNITNLKKDRKKISDYMKRNKFVRKGYFLVYTEATKKREDTLGNRLDKWAEDLNCDLVDYLIDVKSDDEWGWAIGLFRLKD